jgi:hypothetical protein
MADELQFIQAYKDIDRMIDYHKKIIDNCNTEIKYYQKQIKASIPGDISAMNLDGMPHGNFSPISMDRAVEEIRRNEHMNELEDDQIFRLQGLKKEIETIAEKFEGLYLKVAVMKHIEGKPLQQIADKLGYSLDYIKEISASLERNK